MPKKLNEWRELSHNTFVLPNEKIVVVGGNSNRSIEYFDMNAAETVKYSEQLAFTTAEESFKHITQALI